jgi:hypothetical protein
VTPPRWPALFVAGDVLPSVNDGQAGGRIEYRALSASLGVAPFALSATDRFILRPLVAATAGTIAAQASGFQQNESGSRWFAAVSMGGDATFAFGGGILATARVALLLPIVRPRFTYDGPDGPQEVHRVQSVGATIGLGLGWDGR